MYKKVLLISLFVLAVSCSKKEPLVNDLALIDESKEGSFCSSTEDIRWFYFSQKEKGITSLIPIDDPARIPFIGFVPWTEALRVSSIGLMFDYPYILVNHGGVFPLERLKSFERIEESNFSFSSEPFFLTNTASGFYLTDLGVAIRLHRNSVFRVPSMDEEVDPFLCKYNLMHNSFSPLAYAHDFGISPKAQCTNLEYYHNYWYASFKIDEKNTVEFKYFKFKSIDSIMKKEAIEISRDEFRARTRPMKLVTNAKSEDSVFTLLSHITGSSLQVQVFDNKSATRTLLEKIDPGQEESFIEAVACHGNSETIPAALLLSSGNLYYMDSAGLVHTTKLPSLPEKGAYTYFVIHDGIVYAAWEEQSFFEVGRSGLMKCSLEFLEKNMQGI